VPVSGMQLRVEATGPACPCRLFVFSDQVDSGNTPLATATGTLDRLMNEPGPYLLELTPNPSGSNPEEVYSLTFSLTVPPPPVAVVPVEEPTPPPPPTATPSPVPVAVPPVVARLTNEAIDRVRSVGLTPQTQSVDRFSPAGAGTVAAQDPPAGTPLPAGGRVMLLVATGNVAVPAVVGMFEQDAWQTLHDNGFDIAMRRVRRPNVEAGRAASVDPPVGAVEPAGTLVTLTISQGE
jgi:PASTA domain